MKSSVLYTEVQNPDRPLINVEVVAHVTRPELRTSEVSFQFQLPWCKSQMIKGAITVISINHFISSVMYLESNFWAHFSSNIYRSQINSTLPSLSAQKPQKMGWKYEVFILPVRRKQGGLLSVWMQNTRMMIRDVIHLQMWEAQIVLILVACWYSTPKLQVELELGTSKSPDRASSLPPHKQANFLIIICSNFIFLNFYIVQGK